jgi:hypothetical protein
MPLSIMAEPALLEVQASEVDWPGKMLFGDAVMLTVGTGFAEDALRPTQLVSAATAKQAKPARSNWMMTELRIIGE